jgi:hypothetical protein
MRFILDENSITCLPDSVSETIGVNDRKIPVNLTNHTLHFYDTRPTKLPHPDHLALICFITFYPYLKQSSRIQFPRQVSPIWKQILKLHNLTTNANYEISTKEVQSTNKNKSSKEKKSTQQQSIALAFGGGLDSWGVLCLQPHLYSILIHERDPDDPPLPNPPENLREVTTNIKSISTISHPTSRSAGWTTWVGVLTTSIWLSAEYNLTVLATGGNLGSVFLNNGTKYHPTHLKPSIWYKTFELLKLPIYLPLAGLTDLGVSKIIGPNIHHIRYCWFPKPDGSNCHKCDKCIRKELLLGKDNSTSKTFEGPSFQYLRTNDSNLAKWVYHYYTPAFQLVPPEIDTDDIINSLDRHSIKLLPSAYNHLIEQYGFS